MDCDECFLPRWLDNACRMTRAGKWFQTINEAAVNVHSDAEFLLNSYDDLLTDKNRTGSSCKADLIDERYSWERFSPLAEQSRYLSLITINSRQYLPLLPLDVYFLLMKNNLSRNQKCRRFFGDDIPLKL